MTVSSQLLIYFSQSSRLGIEKESQLFNKLFCLRKKSKTILRLNKMLMLYLSI